MAQEGNDNAEPDGLESAVFRLRRKRFNLVCILLTLAFVIAGLYLLARAPYRPPHDMTTLLDGQELQMVWFFIGVFSLCWLLLFVALLQTFRRKSNVGR
jgi:hypothetical protein